jgi:membrane protein required for colicin V production
MNSVATVTQELTHQLNWADWALIAIVLVSALVGVMRGFVRECVSLAVWFVAIVVSMSFSDRASVMLTEYIGTGSLRYVVAFAALFIVTMIAGNLFGYVLGAMVKGIGLSGPDRLLGVCFGVGRGLLIVMVIVIFLPRLIPVDSDLWWKQSTFIPLFVSLESEANQLFAQITGWLQKQFFQ